MLFMFIKLRFEGICDVSSCSVFCKKVSCGLQMSGHALLSQAGRSHIEQAPATAVR